MKITSRDIKGIGISAHRKAEFELVKRLIKQEDSSINCIPWDTIITDPAYLDEIDFLFTIGGDGSVAFLINAFFEAFGDFKSIKPIVPVVRPESVGYLKQLDLLPEDRFREGFREILNNNYELVNRTILKTEIGKQSFISVNEIFLYCNPHIGKFTVTLENNGIKETVTEHLADGAMLVTSIGSTAWALSHGGLINVNEEALQLIFIGATHQGANFILPRHSSIKIMLELKNPVITKETVFAYNQARKQLHIPADTRARDTLNLVYGPRIIIDGKVVGFGPENKTEIVVDPSLSVPLISIKNHSVLEKARKLTKTFYML